MNFDNEYVSCIMHLSDNRAIHVQGNVKNASQYSSMKVIAPHPIDRMTSYSGSGLPWPCPNFAFEGSKNVLDVDVSGTFEGDMGYPNSYYTHDGLHRIPPSIFVILYHVSGGEPISVRIELPEDETLKLRSLTHRTRHREGPTFYSEKEALIGVPLSAEDSMITFKKYKSQYNIA